MFKRRWLSHIGVLGVFLFTYYTLRKIFGLNVKGRLFPIWIEGCQYPFYARYGTSDVGVFNQIFLEKEYACLEGVKAPKLIVDCGANVGYSSIWFLNRYPNARVIAVEPHPENFRLCQKNTLPYGERISVVHAAVWPYETGLIITEGEGGREWAFQVRECQGSEDPDMAGITIDDLLAGSPFETIDILKIDIEKAEKMLFAQGTENWLGKVKNLVIELHDEECKETFFKALAGFDYELSHSGELTVCTQITPKAHGAKRPRKTAGRVAA